jgi:hypothetical protein
VLGRMHLPLHDPRDAEAHTEVPTAVVACHDCGHLSFFALARLFAKEDELVI